MKNEQTVIDDKRLAEIKARRTAATTGPYRAGAVERWHVFVPHSNHEGLGPERVLLRMNEHFSYDADAAFLAASWQDVGDLLAEIDRLRVIERAAYDVDHLHACDNRGGAKMYEACERLRAALRGAR